MDVRWVVVVSINMQWFFINRSELSSYIEASCGGLIIIYCVYCMIYFIEFREQKESLDIFLPGSRFGKVTFRQRDILLITYLFHDLLSKRCSKIVSPNVH